MCNPIEMLKECLIRVWVWLYHMLTSKASLLPADQININANTGGMCYHAMLLLFLDRWDVLSCYAAAVVFGQVGCVIMLCCCCCFWTGGEDYPYVGTYSMCRASGKSVNARLWQEVGRPTDAFAKQRAASL